MDYIAYGSYTNQQNFSWVYQVNGRIQTIFKKIVDSFGQMN